MSVNEVKQSFDKIAGYSDVAKAIGFKEAYRAEHGKRPSLVSVIMLYQSYKAKAEAAEAKLAEIAELADAGVMVSPADLREVVAK